MLDTAFPALLRSARKAACISQLELALRLGFSQRHISFVESGRARPSRDLIEMWLTETGAPPSARNAALLHAGFAQRLPRRAGANVDAHPARAMLLRLLDVHDPYPAFLFSADWFILRANPGAEWLMRILMPGYAAELPPGTPVDMLAACAHPDGMFSCMRDPRIPAFSLLAQVQIEAFANPALKPRADVLARLLHARFGPDPGGIDPAALIHANFNFDSPRGPLEFFRFQSVTDLPQDVTIAAIRAEVWLPANAATKRVMQQGAG